VRPAETTFVLTHAFQTCRRKVFKKSNFNNDKLSSDEKESFNNCIGKYLVSSGQGSEGLR